MEPQKIQDNYTSKLDSKRNYIKQNNQITDDINGLNICFNSSDLNSQYSGMMGSKPMTPGRLTTPNSPRSAWNSNSNTRNY